jgi:hypothetical protein
LTLGRTFIRASKATGDLSSVRIVTGEFDEHLGSSQESDDDVS